MAWGINEWFGHAIHRLQPSERKEMADDVLAGKSQQEIGRLCPFVQHLLPGELCNKKGGVCTIASYDATEQLPPAAVCPRRLLQKGKDERDVFDLLAQECLGVVPGSAYALVREVPFLLKVDEDGNARSAKAGRIDWILVTDFSSPRPEWLAIETQAVYFSGYSMQAEFEAISKAPEKLTVAAKNRRPDWRSSATKRLSPQLEDKQPVMNRWGKKVAVVVDEGFYNEFAAFQNDNVDFDNAEVVWIVAGYDDNMQLDIRIERFAELDESIRAISATRPMPKAQFEGDLLRNIEKNTGKVHFKTVP